MTEENERTDRVNDRLTLIQKTDGITFGTDALLLAGYIGKGYTKGLELGSGSGILSLLLLTRGKVQTVTALEIQEDYADLTAKNAEINGLSDRLSPRLCDVRDFIPAQNESYDLVFTNPPYMKRGTGYENPAERKNIARREIHGTIDDFLSAAGRALNYGGTFAAVYRPERLAPLFAAMRTAGIEPKRATFVHADATAPASLVLVEGRRGGGEGLYLTPPLLLFSDREHTEDSPEMKEIDRTGLFPAKYYQNKG
ncbi:MAG TPA: SAM-dependent methyltransferase [Clostridiales bacterium]|nr:SAM-dependent methyltransferase [Clostridiales bacterium]